MRRLRLIGHFALALLIALAGLPVAHVAFADDARTAVLMPGKSSLYRRIITKPGGRLLAKPGATARVIEDDVPPFSVYYVYGEKNGFTEVGINSRGQASGWIDTDKIVDWKQSIVVAFNNRAEAGRVRHLFYKDIDQLARDLEEIANPMDFVSSEKIVAVEPENAINDNNNFYLLPILDHESTYYPDDNEGNLLQVASVTKEQPVQEERDFRAAVVFVIDTTISMLPYIRQTKAVVEQIGVEIENSELAGKVSFGLIGFRQSERTNPGIGYHVKNLLPLGENSSVEDFVAAIDEMKVATIPTVGFREDSIGGIAFARTDNDWSAYSAKYVVLVTDAGPKSPTHGDNFVRSLDIPELASELDESGIQLLVMHLKTPSGKTDHQGAETRYRQASRLVGSMNDLYTGIEGGDVGGFGTVVSKNGRRNCQDVQRHSA